jgi:hypothetical protein
MTHYQNLTDNWDENGALAPTQTTVDTALALIQSLEKAGQTIYHTAPGPVSEIMINLRNGDKSVELLVYADGRHKIVRIGGLDVPWQGLLTSETLRETLQWLNQ